jgi:hypothetical protein
MLARLLSLLGWRTARSSRPAHQPPRRTASATAHLFAKNQGPVTKDAVAQPRGAKPAPGKGKISDFNPYNTGKFDRSASWERISKNQR